MSSRLQEPTSNTPQPNQVPDNESHVIHSIQHFPAAVARRVKDLWVIESYAGCLQQDQVLTLNQIENAGSRTTGLGIYDRPDHALDFEGLSKFEAQRDGPAKKAEFARLAAAGSFGEPRLFIGKADGNSVLALRDAKGRKRLVLKVAPAGDASIEFLDEAGKVRPPQPMLRRQR
jgi:hypothetical protein